MTGEPWMDAVVVGILGLLIGSFLNVVIHRVPIMMEREWEQECRDYIEDKGWPAPPPSEHTGRFSLLAPASRCPHCGHAIRWYENIPVVSYVALRGKCAGCKARISIRYPLVELITGGLFYWCATQWGWSMTTALWCAFSAALVSLTMIDWDTTLLPDSITLPLLWAGLIGSAAHWLSVPLVDALFGAAAGYLFLWSIYWAFKLLTGKEGMGYGDFKLLAALGAWFGWSALVPIILIASVIGAIVGIGMKLTSSLREGQYVPFGPFLAGAGFAAMLLGPERILQSVLSLLGI